MLFSTPKQFYTPLHWPLWLAFGAYRLLAELPWPIIMGLGRILGRLAKVLTPARVRITEINLKLCFPEWDAQKRRIMIEQHYAALGMGFMDMALAWWASETRIKNWVQVYGKEHLQAASAQGRGVILLTAHFTSIEMGGRALLALLPFGALCPVYRPQRHPFVDYFIQYQRKRYIERTIPREDVRLLLRTLKEHKAVWLAPDQNSNREHDVFAPFFGIPAATHTVIPRLAHLSGALVVPFIALRRMNPPGYDVFIEPAWQDFPSAEIEHDATRMNTLFERWIRQAPEQYLWSHRRFKKRPPGMAGFYE